MLLNKFLAGFKRHRKYFQISVLLIVGYFVGSAIITPKITLVAESLLGDIIKENIRSKRNIINFEFNRLNIFLKYSEDLIEDFLEVHLEDTSDGSFEKLKEKLEFTTSLARSTNLISNSFIYSITSKDMEEVHLSNKEASSETTPISSFLKPLRAIEREISLDSVITGPDFVINRKIYARKLNADTTIVVGYDINLLDFWEYFSETSKGGSGYTVVTNSDGVCILHPEVAFIGHKLDGFFATVSINDIIKHENKSEDSPQNILKDKATSQFLGLEVLRYFDEIKIGNNSLILIESYPIDINLKEATEKIQNYFSWISLLAFLTFMLLLLISRLQLRKEYGEKLNVLEEKEKLMLTNEKYQKENAVLQLDQLKEKMNPHFLFNSLNSLHVLIESNPDLSQEFVFKLAEVYRYLLENKEGNLVKVKDEIKFLEHYIFLQEIRFKNSLKVSIDNTTDDLILFKKIPFLSLQTLVENAIKHNQITKDNPLHIEIIIKENVIVVSNNYTPRTNKNRNSHYLGLAYLKNIYRHHNIENFKAEIVGSKFRSVLPLLP